MATFDPRTGKVVRQDYPYPTAFALECLDTPANAALAGPDGIVEFAGFTYGDGWNGWSTPYFTREAGKRLMQAIRTQCVAFDGWIKAEYDASRDAFIINDGQYPEPAMDEVYSGSDHALADGSTVHVYPIGAYGWTWDERGVHYARQTTGEEAAH